MNAVRATVPIRPKFRYSTTDDEAAAVFVCFRGPLVVAEPVGFEVIDADVKVKFEVGNTDVLVLMSVD